MATVSDLSGNFPASLPAGADTTLADCEAQITTTTLTAAATAVIICAANPRRKAVVLVSTNTNPAHLGFSNAVTAANGMPMTAAASASDAGGGYFFHLDETYKGDIYGYSTLGTEVRALQMLSKTPR